MRGAPFVSNISPKSTQTSQEFSLRLLASASNQMRQANGWWILPKLPQEIYLVRIVWHARTVMMELFGHKDSFHGADSFK